MVEKPNEEFPELEDEIIEEPEEDTPEEEEIIEEPEEEPETPAGGGKSEPDEYAHLELEGISDEERENPLYKKFQAHFTRVRQRDAAERREYEALKAIIQEDPEVKKALKKRLGLEEPEEPVVKPPNPEEFLEDPQGYINRLVEAKLNETVKPIQSTLEKQAQKAQLARWEAEIKGLQSKYEDFPRHEEKMTEYLQKKPLVAQAVLDGEMTLEEVFRLVAGPTVTRKAKARKEKAQRNASPSRPPSNTSEPTDLDQIIREAIREAESS